MIGAIPNPTKTHIVSFPIGKVKVAVERITKISKKYKFTSSNNVFNQTTLEAYELLSLGVYIDISLSEIAENKTQITVEVRRKIGSFNQSSEVTNANIHLNKIFEFLGKAIELDDSAFLDFLNEEGQLEIKKKKDEKFIFVYLLIVIIIIAYFLSK